MSSSAPFSSALHVCTLRKLVYFGCPWCGTVKPIYQLLCPYMAKKHHARPPGHHRIAAATYSIEMPFMCDEAFELSLSA